jgi:hypothetical protein
MKRVALVLLGIFVVLMFAQSMIPAAASMVSTIADELSTTVLAIAPKIAVGAAAIGLILCCTHWTRKHGQKWILGAIICAVGAAAVSGVFAWFGSESQTVSVTSTTLAGDLITRVLGGLQAGIGGLP